MPIWRLQLSHAVDSLFPADRIMITPHFHDDGATTDPQNLCQDLANAWATYCGSPMVNYEINVKAYDAQGTPPVYPQGDYTRGAGVTGGASTNREIAMCLSYYSGENRPRKRGRLYIANCLIGITATGNRPVTANQQRVLDLAPILANLGGVDVDWCVYSRLDDAAYPVSNAFVDNAWDIQRRRGVRPTSRLSATVGE